MARNSHGDFRSFAWLVVAFSLRQRRPLEFAATRVLQELPISGTGFQFRRIKTNRCPLRSDETLQTAADGRSVLLTSVERVEIHVRVLARMPTQTTIRNNHTRL